LEIVFALAGDSTITSDLAIPFSSLRDKPLPCQGNMLKSLWH